MPIRRTDAADGRVLEHVALRADADEAAERVATLAALADVGQLHALVDVLQHHCLGVRPEARAARAQLLVLDCNSKYTQQVAITGARTVGATR